MINQSGVSSSFQFYGLPSNIELRLVWRAITALPEGIPGIISRVLPGVYSRAAASPLLFPKHD